MARSVGAKWKLEAEGFLISQIVEPACWGAAPALEFKDLRRKAVQCWGCSWGCKDAPAERCVLEGLCLCLVLGAQRRRWLLDEVHQVWLFPPWDKAAAIPAQEKQKGKGNMRREQDSCIAEVIAHQFGDNLETPRAPQLPVAVRQSATISRLSGRHPDSDARAQPGL